MHGPDPITAFVLVLLCYAIVAVTLMIAAALVFLPFDLILGCGLLAILKKKRHLFWLLPLGNVALYLLFSLLGWRGHWLIQLLDSRLANLAPDLSGPVAAVPWAVVCGWLSALVLVPTASLWHWWRNRTSTGKP